MASLFALEELDALDAYVPRYNIAPSQELLTIVQDGDHRKALFAQWGLIPRWAAQGPASRKLVNVRSETVVEKFRASFQALRCVFPASGFYEWKDELESQKATGLFEELSKPAVSIRQPYLFTVDERPFGLAGILERTPGPNGEPIVTGAVLTAPSNDSMKEFHERMPCLLSLEEIGDWLSPKSEIPVLRSLMEPIEGSRLSYRRVDRRLNDARTEGAFLVA